MYASFLGISKALHLGISCQPLRHSLFAGFLSVHYQTICLGSESPILGKEMVAAPTAPEASTGHSALRTLRAVRMIRSALGR